MGKNYSGVIGLHGNKQGLYFHQKGEMFPAASTVGCLLIAVVIKERTVVIGDVVGNKPIFVFNKHDTNRVDTLHTLNIL